jgi:hypothetical protein
MEGIKKALVELEGKPQQSELIVGYLSLCKYLKTTPEQVAALTWCTQAILADHPILALKIMKIALLLDPADRSSNALIQDVLRRRGRWASEQRLSELNRTTLLTSAASYGVPDFLVAHSEQSASFTSVPPIAWEEPGAAVAETPIQKRSNHEISQAPTRASEFLVRCGFSQELLRYAQGMSSNNCGLVTFVGVLQRLSLVKPSEMPLALHMLRKMIDENPDSSEALLLYSQLFESAEPADDGVS